MTTTTVTSALQDLEELIKDRDQVIKEELEKLSQIIKQYKHYFRLSDALSSQTMGNLEEEIVTGMDELLETAKIGELSINEQMEHYGALLDGAPEVKVEIKKKVETSSNWIREEVIGSIDQWRNDMRRAKMAFINFAPMSRGPITRSLTLAVSNAYMPGTSPYSKENLESAHARNPVNRAITTVPAGNSGTSTSTKREKSTPTHQDPENPGDTAHGRKKIGRAIAYQSGPRRKVLVADNIESGKILEEMERLFRDRDEFMKEARERILVLLEQFKDLAKISDGKTEKIVVELETTIHEAMDDYVQCKEDCEQALSGLMEKYSGILEVTPEKQKEFMNKITITSRLKHEQMLGDLHKYNRQLELVKRSFIK